MHDQKVMGDEQVRNSQLFLQVLEHVDDLSLDRHIQRRYCLVADNELRLGRKCPGDADSLALSA